MNKPDRRLVAQIMRDYDLLQIVATPAVLYFPPEVLGQLNELCELRGLTPGQLIAEAFKSQHRRIDQFINELITPQAPGESEAWPEDPLHALACVALIHLMDAFVTMVEDPPAFKQQKKDAPVEWSFRSSEQDADPADWWKGAKRL